MIIGKYESNYTAYVSSAGSCGKTRQGKWYWREGAYNSSPFNSCAEAQRDWDKKYGHLNITKHPDSTAGGGGLSANSQLLAQGRAITPRYASGSSVGGQASSHGGLSANSQALARSGGGTSTTSSSSPTKLQSRFTPSTNSAASNTVKGTTNAGVSASGKAGAGVTAGASVTATVSDLKAKTNQVVSDVLPDSIEDKIEDAGIPLWLLPVGIVGAGLLLVLMLRR